MLHQLILLVLGATPIATKLYFTDSVQFVTTKAVVFLNYSITIIENDSASDFSLENSFKITASQIMSAFNETISNIKARLNTSQSLSTTVDEHSIYDSIDSTIESLDIQSTMFSLTPSFTDFSEPIRSQMTNMRLGTMATEDGQVTDTSSYEATKFITGFSILVPSNVSGDASSTTVNSRLPGVLTEENVLPSLTPFTDFYFTVTSVIVTSTFHGVTNNTTHSNEGDSYQLTPTLESNIITKLPTPIHIMSSKTPVVSVSSPLISVNISTGTTVVSMPKTTIDSSLETSRFTASSSVYRQSHHSWDPLSADAETISQYNTLSTMKDSLTHVSDTFLFHITTHGQLLQPSSSTTATISWPVFGYTSNSKSRDDIHSIDTGTLDTSQRNHILSNFSTTVAAPGSSTSDILSTEDILTGSTTNGIFDTKDTTERMTSAETTTSSPTITTIGEWITTLRPENTTNKIPTKTSGLTNTTNKISSTTSSPTNTTTENVSSHIAWSTATTMKPQTTETNTTSEKHTYGEATPTSRPLNITLGESTTTSSPRNTTLGESTTTSSQGNTTLGESTTTSSQRNTTLGESTTTSSPASTTLGESTTASSPASPILGKSTTTSSPTSATKVVVSISPAWETSSPATTMTPRTTETTTTSPTKIYGKSTTSSPPKITLGDSSTKFSPPNITLVESNTTSNPTNTTKVVSIPPTWDTSSPAITMKPRTTETPTSQTNMYGESTTTSSPTNSTLGETTATSSPARTNLGESTTTSSPPNTAKDMSTIPSTWSISNPATTMKPRTTATTTTSPTVVELKEMFQNTLDPSTLSLASVTEYAEKVLKLYNEALNDLQVARNAFSVIGNLGDVNESISRQAEKENKTNSRLRAFLNNYTAEVELESNNGVVSINTTKLQVLVMSLKELNRINDSTFPFEFESTDKNGTTGMKLNVTVKFPMDLLNKIYNESVDNRIQFVAYKRSQLFVPFSGFPDDVSILNHQRVVSASIKGKHLGNLKEPIVIILPVIKVGEMHSCVYWNTADSRWSTDGIIPRPNDNDTDHVTCLSSHLTSFAVVLSHNLPGGHEAILTYVTYIGCGISMTGLLITIITYTVFKCLNQEKPVKVLVNLCTALLLLNVVFLVATVNVSNYSDVGCLVAGMLLHYLVLSSLMWMLVEAVGIYQALVIVFITYERFHLIKRCLLAWGLPVLIVSITAAVDSGVYSRNKTTSKFCLMTRISTTSFYASLLAPASVIILINIAVFIRVARIILRPNFQNQMMSGTSKVTLSQIRGAVTVMFLLGVTWVFGPLAIGEAATAFNYLFCVCTSFQGCAIFIFRCLCNKEARLAWVQLLRTGTFKSRQGPYDSAVSDFICRNDDRKYSNSNTSGVVDDSSSRKTSTTTTSSRHDSLPDHYYTATTCHCSNRQSGAATSESILDSACRSLGRLPPKFRRISPGFGCEPLVMRLPRHALESSELSGNLSHAYQSEFTHL